VFYMVLAVNKFDFRGVTNEIPNTWRPVERWFARDSCLYVFPRPSCGIFKESTQAVQVKCILLSKGRYIDCAQQSWTFLNMVMSFGFHEEKCFFCVKYCFFLKGSAPGKQLSSLLCSNFGYGPNEGKCEHSNRAIGSIKREGFFLTRL